MASVVEGTHRADDGKELFTTTWKTASPPIAKIVFVHGFSDHCGRYSEVMPAFAAAGIQVFGYDQRGFGKSVKSHADMGALGTTEQAMADISSVLRAHLPSPVPLFLMGHSMGGGETLYFASKGPEDLRRQISGYIVSSPWVALHPRTQPWNIVVYVGRVFAKFLPGFRLPQKLDCYLMSHDKAACEDWRDDKLCHDIGTLQTLAGCLDRGLELSSGSVMIPPNDSTRLIILHGDADGVTSYAASKDFAERCQVKDKAFKSYPDGFHCVYAEPNENKTNWTNDIITFVARIVRETSTSKSKL